MRNVNYDARRLRYKKIPPFQWEDLEKRNAYYTVKRFRCKEFFLFTGKI